jgi:FolB domain-containing protein
MDKIHIRDLLARCILGEGQEERRDRQDVKLNITLHTDSRQPGASDKLADAVDYRAINKRILRYAETSEHSLVEALAERIAQICLEHPRVLAVQVSVEKPGALRFARSVGVEITRQREA